MQWNRCPTSSSDEAAREIVTLFSRLRDGHLPAAGGWSDQTVFAWEAFRVAGLEWSKLEERRREDASN